MKEFLKLHFWFSVFVGMATFGYLCDDPEVAGSYLVYALAYCTIAGIVCWAWDIYTMDIESEEE